MDDEFEIYCDDDGNIECKIYYDKDGFYHREDGPAVTFYDGHGQIIEEQYCQHGEDHRVDGPAKIWYAINGAIYSEEYWLEGIYYNDIFKYSVAVGNLK